MRLLLARFEQSVLRVYQAWSATRLPRCRYLPTCSHYAVEALHTHGLWRGNRLIARRLLRCHPWGGWGADPVPPADSFAPSRHHFPTEIRAHS